MDKKSFHNTTGIDYTAAALSEGKSQKQEEIILNLFKKEKALLSPDYVWMASGLFNNNVPLTSVRRAISNLTQLGSLVKSEKKTIGRWGKPQFTWVYVEYSKENEEQTNFLKP